MTRPWSFSKKLLWRFLFFFLLKKFTYDFFSFSIWYRLTIFFLTLNPGIFLLGRTIALFPKSRVFDHLFFSEIYEISLNAGILLRGRKMGRSRNAGLKKGNSQTLPS